MPTYRNLDKTPRILFLPGEQVYAWLAIAFFSWLFIRKMLGLSWVWTSVVGLWGIATWWTLTSKGMYHFFGKLIAVPRWSLATLEYEPVLKKHHGQKNRQLKSRRPQRARRKP